MVVIGLKKKILVGYVAKIAPNVGACRSSGIGSTKAKLKTKS